MAKLIVEMEMPRDCWGCPNGHPDWIYNDDGAAQMVCFCNICNTEEDDRWISETETERPSWCLILGVLPEQHGDLIDRDDLRKHGMMYRGGIDEGGLIYVPLRDVMKSISNAPAVIAAERKDDERI